MTPTQLQLTAKEKADSIFKLKLQLDSNAERAKELATYAVKNFIVCWGWISYEKPMDNKEFWQEVLSHLENYEL